MLDTFSKCEHPQFVYNKYIKDYVLVECGKCPACKDKDTERWVARMFQERKCWQFCFSLYLDYNDEHLPTYDLCNGYLKERQMRFWTGRHEFHELCFPVDEMEDCFETEFDRQYFYERLYDHYTSVPHASVRDIQNFKKRLNRYIQREVTGKYSNFRSCIAAEYGPTTFRPHYHGILFFNDPRIAENLERLVVKAWSSEDTGSFGHTEVEGDRGNTAGYVAKYIKKPNNLPSCYAHPNFAPKFLTSRCPPIGSLLQSRTEILELFHQSSCTRVAFSVEQDDVQIRAFPIDRYTEDRLFPKCPLYSEVASTVRTDLYKSVIDPIEGLIPTFEEYIFKILCRTRTFIFGETQDGWLKFLQSIGYNHDWIDLSSFDTEKIRVDNYFELVDSDFCRLIDIITDNWHECSRLRSLYVCGCRIWYQSQLFNVSFDYYLNRIYEHYEKKDLFTLRHFYSEQASSLADDPDLDWRYFYPYSFDVDIEKHPLSVAYFDAKDKKRKKGNRTKFKNVYFESLKDKEKDASLYNIITNFYYGKECNEIIETIA